MRTAAGVMAAGALGAAARYGIGIWLAPAGAAGFPWATLAANLSGCLLLGILTGAAARRAVAPFWRETAGTGFIGSFTTFSAFAVETVNLVHGRHAGLAAVYVLLSMTAGLALAHLGAAVGRQGAGSA